MADLSAEAKAWCIQELLKVTETDDDITGCILSMTTVEELESYLRRCLDTANPDHVKVMSDFSDLLASFDVNSSGYSYSQKCSGDFSGKLDPPLKSKGKVVGLSQEKESKKKSPRFVPLYSREGQARTAVRLPGRHPCECLGQKHGLVNNCTECGRIVCQQEGSGPCYFCGALVCTKEEQEILAKNSKKSNKLYEKLLTQSITAETSPSMEKSSNQSLGSEGLQEAIAHKNRLLEYGKSGIRRTKVIDDECDYFASDTNKWLSKKERDTLKKKEQEQREKRHGSPRQMKVTFDFAGRRVIDEREAEKLYLDPGEPVLASGFYSNEMNLEVQGVANPNVINVSSLKFIPTKTGRSKPVSFENSAMKHSEKVVCRIQDKEFQEMSDTGMCLSMHQPWASLLVVGIKMVEGRTWYSAHRGRLWIAATARKPGDHDIRAVEEMYRNLYPNKNLEFPKEYPTSCLLGCVDLVDCLGQEDYRSQLPDGESESPYVFVCENPQKLAIKFPIKGQHKIWKLDAFVHKAAQAGLRAVA